MWKFSCGLNSWSNRFADDWNRRLLQLVVIGAILSCCPKAFADGHYRWRHNQALVQLQRTPSGSWMTVAKQDQSGRPSSLLKIEKERRGCSAPLQTVKWKRTWTGSCSLHPTSQRQHWFQTFPSNVSSWRNTQSLGRRKRDKSLRKAYTTLVRQKKARATSTTTGASERASRWPGLKRGVPWSASVGSPGWGCMTFKRRNVQWPQMCPLQAVGAAPSWVFTNYAKSWILNLGNLETSMLARRLTAEPDMDHSWDCK